MGGGGGVIPALSLALSHFCSTAPPSPICQLLVVLGVREGRDGGRKPSGGYRGPEGELAPTQILATPSLSLHLTS